MATRRWVRAAVLAAVFIGIFGVGADGAGAGPGPQGEHDRIVAFWTPERVAQAKPRDFVYDPATRSFRPAGKPGGGGGGGGGGSTVLGASWTGGGTVANTTGKVLFAFGSSYYVCSASVVTDGVTNRSIILTAAHCAYDEANRRFATNWLFIPNYDAKPARLDTSGSFCRSTLHGCWTASALVVSKAYAGAGGFNDIAVQHDYAFAVVGSGGLAASQLDDTVGSQGISFSAVTTGADTWLFGYPASQKYKGNDLVYCRGPVGFDPSTGNATYRVGCDMTGGSSGGPWFSPFIGSTGNGTTMSVNSYGYSGITAMHGPKLGTEAQQMFATAATATGNTLHG